jgi:hypothetical protein
MGFENGIIVRHLLSDLSLVVFKKLGSIVDQTQNGIGLTTSLNVTKGDYLPVLRIDHVENFVFVVFDFDILISLKVSIF